MKMAVGSSGIMNIKKEEKLEIEAPVTRSDI